MLRGRYRRRQVRPVGLSTGWHRDYSPPAWRNRATEEQKREGWEMAVRIEKIIATVLRENYGFGMILEEALY